MVPLITDKEIVKCVKLVQSGVKRATKYITENFVVSAQRIGKLDKRNAALFISLKIGKPNYAERKFIALARKAKAKFPIKKIQLKFDKEKKK